MSYNYTTVFSDSNITVADLGMSYLIMVKQDIMIEWGKVFRCSFNIQLQVQDFGFYFAIPSTSVPKGGYGSSELVLTVSSYGLSIYNQNTVNESLKYTIPTTVWVPKMY